MVAGLLLNSPISIIHVQGFSQHAKWIFPEPINSTQLIAVAVVFVLALRRVRPESPSGAKAFPDRSVEFEMDRPVVVDSTAALGPTPAVS
jgi:hypothetical protein